MVPSNIDLETLITCLDDPDKFVRKSALQAAAEIGSPLLLQAVRKNLRHFDDNVQIEAAKAVLQLDNNDAEPIRVLENLYFNRNIPTTRSDVLYAIADLDSRVLQAPKMLLSALDAPSEMRSMTFFQYDTGMYVEALDALAACGQQSLGAIGNWLADDSTTLRVRVRLLELLSESEWNAKELRPIIEKHVLSDDVSVRKPALLILRNIGDVNADLVIDHLNGGAGVRQAAAIALRNVSAATRSSAINALITLLQDESPAVRVAAARSFLSLNDDSAPAVESLIGLIPNLAELGWEDFNALQAIIEQLRPSPQKLIAKLLAAAQERDEQSRAVTLLGSMDASAFDARVSLLAHSDGSTRASALSQLGNSGEARAIPHIVKHLSDHGKYDVSISIDMGFESEVRIAAMEALSAPGLNVESIIPLLTERLQDDWSRAAAATALGQAGPAARVALPVLHALEIKEPSDESLQIATAIARLETDSQRQTIRYEKLFQLIASPGFCLQEPNGTDFERTLVQLADSGRPLYSLKEPLIFLATTHDCLHHSWRIRAACALAVLDSENPQWRQMLQHGKTLEKFGSGEATSGLELLEERTK